MNILDKWAVGRIKKRATKGGTAYMSDPDSWLQQLVSGGAPDVSGVTVNNDTALRCIAVYACIRVLAETVASLPLKMYRRLEKGKELAKEHPLYKVLHEKPNSEQTPFQFKELLTAHAVSRGNGYANIVRNGAGDIIELWPLLPHQMQVMREGGQLKYLYTTGDGKEWALTRREVFHLPGLGYDGIKGYNPIEMARQSIGLAMATEKYGAAFFGNNARMDGIIKLPGTLKDEPARKRFRESWESAHQGLDNAHRVAILEQGADWVKTSIEPDHAQFLDTRKYSTKEIARLFRIPPHLVGDLDNATYTNIEHQGIEAVVYTFRPWCIRWEQAISTQLLTEREAEYFAEYLMDALMRGDAIARSTFYRTMREIGVYSANDIREMENQNPLDDGDKYFVPGNWIDASAEPPEPAPPAGPPAQDDKRSIDHESRAQRSGQARYRIAKTYRRVMADAFQRLIKREAGSIREAMKTHLPRRDKEGFTRWLDDYYSKIGSVVVDRTKPIYRAMSEAIKSEVSVELDKQDGFTEKDERFVDEYVATFAKRHAEKSAGAIKKVMRQAVEAGADEQDEIEAELAKWESERAGADAQIESTRGGGAFAKSAFLIYGIVKLRWLNTGKSSCPWCSNMDGKIVGIDQFFTGAGDTLKDGDKNMNVFKDVGHPPLHGGCDCVIISA